MKYENLNKENFWNKMYSQYPNAMKDFCEWIDEYKKLNDWDNLFEPKYIKIKGSKIGGLASTKFHEIPLAMQMGIWNEYLDSYSLEKCKSEIESALYAMEQSD